MLGVNLEVSYKLVEAQCRETHEKFHELASCFSAAPELVSESDTDLSDMELSQRSEKRKISFGGPSDTIIYAGGKLSELLIT
jgi:hypothetical protein